MNKRKPLLGISFLFVFTQFAATNEMVIARDGQNTPYARAIRAGEVKDWERFRYWVGMIPENERDSRIKEWRSLLAQEYVRRGMANIAKMASEKDTALFVARARTAFMLATVADMRNVEARYQLGLLYQNAFKYNECALEELELFVRLMPTADERVRQVTRTILPDLRQSIEASRSGAQSRDSAKCAVELVNAEVLLKKRMLKDAVAHYKAAYYADSQSYPAAFGFARALERINRLDRNLVPNAEREALMYYGIASWLRPGSASALLEVGRLAQELNMYLKAADAYSRVLAKWPEHHLAADGLIQALAKQGHTEEADVYHRYRIELDELLGKKQPKMATVE